MMNHQIYSRRMHLKWLCGRNASRHLEIYPAWSYLTSGSIASCECSKESALKKHPKLHFHGWGSSLWTEYHQCRTPGRIQVVWKVRMVFSQLGKTNFIQVRAFTLLLIIDLLLNLSICLSKRPPTFLPVCLDVLWWIVTSLTASLPPPSFLIQTSFLFANLTCAGVLPNVCLFLQLKISLSVYFW